MTSNQLDDDIKMLKSAGFKAIAKQYEEMATTLKVIRTWASFKNGSELEPDEVLRLTSIRLARFTKYKTKK